MASSPQPPLLPTEIAAAALREHVEVAAALPPLLPTIAELATRLVETLRRDGRVLLCGNGGSAADAQHLAAELVGRFLCDRQPFPALALTTDTSILTAVANDIGYMEVFARQVLALGRPGDMLIVISTSGNSPSVLRAAEAARQQGLTVAGLTGRTGGKLRPMCDMCLCVPSEATPRIQEMHILIGHILCDVAERTLGEAER
ncbi:SIS domain-containing protein [Chloracidobacterium thermophilum]|uniref:D-sedoheptulose-7-phosphate isomerase n=1 Tax=Chloracidobacterium thermophilum TaxID=458033 RepID=UPI000738CF45|nr:D-sedoheptulose 7-phosphate isomerase [Chloracidobacterium thermophilum]